MTTLTEAAEAAVANLFLKPRTDEQGIALFKSGALWAMRESPEVRALVEVIELMGCSDGPRSHNEFGCPGCKALTAYRASVENK